MNTKETKLSRNKVKLYIIKEKLLFIESSNISMRENQISEKEMKILKTLYLKNENNLNLEAIYKGLTDSNYTIIRIYNNLCSIFIGKTIKENDKEEILKILKEIEKNNKLKKFEIYNRIDVDYGKETEILEAINIEQMQEKVEILLNEKLGCLSKQEQKMLKEYREFDLKKLLTVDDSGYIINNNNTGVIVITPKNIISSTIRRKNFTNQIDSIIRNIYYNDYIKTDFLQKNYSNIFHTIIIQIMPDGSILINKLEKINQFQIDILLDYAKLIRKINKDTIVYMGDENINAMSRKIEIDNYINFISNIKTEILDNIKPLKNSKEPKARKIGTLQLEAIFEVKKKDNLSKIKIELVQYAMNGLSLNGNSENHILKEITENNVKKSEAYEIISKIEEKYIQKIPKEILEKLKQNKLQKFQYNINKTMKEQNISEYAVKLLSYINLEYWCNSKEKDEIERIYKYNENKINLNDEEILKNLQKDGVELEAYKNKDKALAILNNEGFWLKMLHKIKKVLGLKTKMNNI